MPTEWYIESMGKVVGPLSPVQLLQKVRSGEITENTQIRKDDSQWVNASEVNGLFEAAKRPNVRYKCPYCGAQIDKPPTTCLGCDREVTAAYRQRERAPVPGESSAAVVETPLPEENGNGTIVHTVVSWL